MFTTIRTRLLQVSFLALILSAALGLNYVIAWTGPTAAAPNINVAAPLNVSTATQVKPGNISVGLSSNTTADNGLRVYGSQTTSGTVYGNGNAGGVLGNGVYGTAGGSNTHGVVGIGPSNNTAYGVIGVGGGSPYYGALGRADGYSFVGNGQLWNQGIIRSVSGGFAFPDGSVQTSAGGSLASMQCVTKVSAYAAGWATTACDAGYTAMSGGCNSTCSILNGNYLSGNTQVCTITNTAGSGICNQGGQTNVRANILCCK